MAGASPGGMRIAAVTLNNQTGDIVFDAIASVVDWVDVIIQIDTHAEPYDWSREREACKGKLEVVPFGLITWDTSSAWTRNEAHRFAAERGADWVVTLDTDERIRIAPGFDIRGELARALDDGITSILTRHAKWGTYAKDKIIRAPFSGQWEGHVHEAWVSTDKRVEWEGKVWFDEIPKTPEQMAAKLQNLKRQLTMLTEREPENARYWYYFGDTLDLLDEKQRAADAFLRCAELTRWDEEAAFALFRAGAIANDADDFEGAARLAACGLAHRADFGDLAFLAASASFNGKNYKQALRWADIAISNGNIAGKPEPRIIFSWLPGLWEGPFEVKARALDALGRTEAAQEAWRQAKHAYAARAARLGIPVEESTPEATEPAAGQVEAPAVVA